MQGSSSDSWKTPAPEGGEDKEIARTHYMSAEALESKAFNLAGLNRGDALVIENSQGFKLRLQILDLEKPGSNDKYASAPGLPM